MPLYTNSWEEPPSAPRSDDGATSVAYTGATACVGRERKARREQRSRALGSRNTRAMAAPPPKPANTRPTYRAVVDDASAMVTKPIASGNVSAASTLVRPYASAAMLATAAPKAAASSERDSKRGSCAGERRPDASRPGDAGELHYSVSQRSARTERAGAAEDRPQEASELRWLRRAPRGTVRRAAPRRSRLKATTTPYMNGATPAERVSRRS